MTKMKMNEAIWLQPGTRAHMLVDRGTHWQLWTSTNTRVGDSSEWFGTYIELWPSGMAIQRIREPNDERRIVLREGRR